MTREKLIQKAYEFEKKNERITWKPNDFPEGIRSFANSNNPAKKIGTSVFTEEGHDYLVVDTKHGVCVIHAESCPCHKNK